MRIRINDACIIINMMGRVAGIEPASLAWKARGYSRRQFIIFNVSNSKPNMKLWFHSAPLWKMDRFPDLSRKRNSKKKEIRPITSMSAFMSECIQNNSLSR